MNIQRKKRRHWFTIGIMCQDCLKRAKMALTANKIQWRVDNGQFQVYAPNTQKIDKFLKENRIGVH